ncbi:MAG: gamma-glutamylcyclotransferase [Planctomycetales bacterium]|nr:gamma-glutamylcyclotransferase [Planctomycetales bacterium]
MTGVDHADPAALFVYGTLKRGECRELCWPHPPLEVRHAVVTAALYDLGLYPALGEGEDRVEGEIWYLSPSQMESTLAVLDEIECYHRAETDLYVRRIIECVDQQGQTHRAFTYFYAPTQTLPPEGRVAPGADGLCRWSGRGPQR